MPSKRILKHISMNWDRIEETPSSIPIVACVKTRPLTTDVDTKIAEKRCDGKGDSCSVHLSERRDKG